MDRFWADVAKGERCWERHVAPSQRYGRVTVGGRRYLAHRYAYMLVNGPIPHGMVISHVCDNTRCVRPDHLTVATVAENMRDAARKDRIAYGQRVPRARLSTDQVAEIRRRRLAGEPTTSLARVFGVHSASISRITRGEAWARADGPLVATMSHSERGALSRGPRGALIAIPRRG